MLGRSELPVLCFCSGDDIVLNTCLGQVPRGSRLCEKQRGGSLLGSALRIGHLGMWLGARQHSPAQASSWLEAEDSGQPPPQPVLPLAGGVRTSVLEQDRRGMSQHLAESMFPTETDTEAETGKYFRR